MTDPLQNALNPNPADGQGAAGDPAPASQAPAWMEGFAADSPLRSNPDLLRMGTVEDLAKGYTETRTWAKGRVAIPDWANPDQVKEFKDKLRPADATAYEIDFGGENNSPELADAYRQFAFDSGHPPAFVKETADFWNRQQGEMLSRLGQANETALDAVKIELGPEGFARRVEAVNAMLSAAGLDVDIIGPAMQHLASMDKDGKAKPGAGDALRALFTLAEKTGELDKVDPAGIQLRMGTMTPDAAKAERDKRMNDMSPEGREWMKQAAIAGTKEYQRWKDISRAMAGG